MPKALCMSGMVVAILIAILFLFDLAAPPAYAPFRKADWLMDVLMLVCAGMLGFISWMTWREQK
jgi:threonine/homoserine/homoserine lactone efflux protein